MKSAYLVVLIFVVSLAGCALDGSKNADSPSAVGSDRDKHGCIGSAGYKWCARTENCERPWELAEEKGFANAAQEFEEYCGG